MTSSIPRHDLKGILTWGMEVAAYHPTAHRQLWELVFQCAMQQAQLPHRQAVLQLCRLALSAQDDDAFIGGLKEVTSQHQIGTGDLAASLCLVLLEVCQDLYDQASQFLSAHQR
jgi:hypothetical protein